MAAYDIFLDAYQLHSIAASLPTNVHQPFSGLDAADVRLDAYDNPGEDGQTVAGNYYGQRLITLQGRIRGVDAATYEANRLALAQAVGIQRDGTGNPIPRILKLTKPSGTTYRISVVRRAFKNPEMYPTFSDWYVELVATKPFIESDAQTTLTLGLPVSSGVVYPVVYPIVFGASSGGSATAVNAGTAPAFPVFTLAGPMINPILTNDATGEYLGLSLTLLNGDRLIIDASARTILLNGATNKMGAKTLGSTFWALAPGANTLRLSADVYDAGTASVAYRSSWDGI